MALSNGAAEVSQALRFVLPPYFYGVLKALPLLSLADAQFGAICDKN